MLIGGKRYPVVERICMDQCMVSLGKSTSVKVGDAVVSVGRQENEEITLEELGDRMGSINGEILTMINQRVPRVYLPKEILAKS